ncbi:HNH endonuclease [Lysinibacillus capsici]|uniref:HNH endonuclease n=1 Tax=Lysinibacillus capsici TaxID=2115968 RepID=UPI003D02CF0C
MNTDNVKKSIVHATFQIMLNNRRFMHDFNVMVDTLIEKDIDYIIEIKLEFINLKKNRIKRATYWPTWLKQALFYHDKGTCVLCRKDVTSQYHIASDLEIDYIVPLDLYGPNDSTNFQLLCKSCNASKQAGSTSTNLINVPYWNI